MTVPVVMMASPLLTEGESSSSRTASLDTWAIAFTVQPDFEVVGGHVQLQHYGQPGAETVTVRHQLPGGGFLALGKGGKGWLEASAKRAHGGSNVEAMSVPEVKGAKKSVHASAGSG